MCAAPSIVTPAQRFRAALRVEQPLQIVGTINAYSALQARAAGFRAIYLSGAGVANASHGLPDLAMTHLEDVLIDLRRLTAAVDLPVLVDIDTGWGTALTLNRTIREIIRAGAAAAHLEDQVVAKRCGHRPGKAVVTAAEMCDRIKAAADAKTDPDFFLIARTDAVAVEGLASAVQRAGEYVAAGADGIFAEACRSPEDLAAFVQAVSVPVLANCTEFGQSPLFSRDELKRLGVSMALYPLTAFRAMALAAETTYQMLRRDGDQKACLDHLQTRADLYTQLGYHDYEGKIDAILRESRVVED